MPSVNESLPQHGLRNGLSEIGAPSLRSKWTRRPRRLRISRAIATRTASPSGRVPLRQFRIRYDRAVRSTSRAVIVLSLLVVAGLSCAKKSEPVRFEGAPVILISIDTLRSDHLPVYGYNAVETPVSGRSTKAEIAPPVA